jgi:hypothetical protein
MRHRWQPYLSIAGTLILLVAAACTSSIATQIQSSCACTFPPTHPPGWTPTPPPALSIAQAEDIASHFAGQAMSSYGSWDELGGQPVLVTHGADAYAYVNGNTGSVLSAFFANELLTEPQATTSADDAVTAAERWLATAGVPTDGAAPSVQARSAANLPYFEVSWTQAGSAGFEVLINAAGGDVFAYRDLRVSMAVPLVGFRAASVLAERSPLAHGEPASPGDIDNLLGDPSGWIWTIGFNDGALSVDAATGAVAVMKWADQK